MPGHPATAALLLAAVTPAAGREIDLDPPGPREFIVDRAGLLDDAAEQRIRARADALLTEKAVPIVVVTVPTRAAVGGGGLSNEAFARRLFDAWGVGPATVNGRDWNRGILLVVSPGDREARIELGAGWGGGEHAESRRIMDEYLVPNFRRERYAEGIEAGVAALDAMARGLDPPAPPRPWWYWPLIFGAAGLATFTVVSLFRSGAGGWAWAFWAVVFAVVGAVLYHAATSRGSGGGYGGGSFGGGFSGGGGASGSW